MDEYIINKILLYLRHPVEFHYKSKDKDNQFSRAIMYCINRKKNQKNIKKFLDEYSTSLYYYPINDIFHIYKRWHKNKYNNKQNPKVFTLFDFERLYYQMRHM